MKRETFNNVEQRSPEWFALRRGIVTASVVGRLVTVGTPDALTVQCPKCIAKPGDPCLSITRKTPTPIKSVHDARSSLAADQPPGISVADNDTSRAVVGQLVAERITGIVEETRMTDDMWRGVEMEPYARDIYSGHYQQAVECGFMRLEGDGFTIGFSPDGLVAHDGLIEVKCPRPKGHVNTILAGEVPAYYMAQCQTGLLVSGRKWLDYVSFCAGLPLFVRRVLPDPKWFEAIIEAAKAFEITAAAMLSDYATKSEGLPPTERIDLEVVI